MVNVFYPCYWGAVLADLTMICVTHNLALFNYFIRQVMIRVQHCLTLEADRRVLYYDRVLNDR